jgi:hypothetical protein
VKSCYGATLQRVASRPEGPRCARPRGDAVDHARGRRRAERKPRRRVPAKRGRATQRLIQTYNDWQVGSAGFFGVNKQATLTAYVVNGTAPGMVTADGRKPISNVVHEMFTIGG